MAIKVLCIGDVVGSPGRRVLVEGLGRVVKEHNVDCVVVNAENAANGSGLTPDIHGKTVSAGAHLLTMGNHVYRRREIFPILETNEFIVRPANLPHGAPGREFAIYTLASGQRVAAFCLLGRMFMNVLAECPYRAADRVLKRREDDALADRLDDDVLVAFIILGGERLPMFAYVFILVETALAQVLSRADIHRTVRPVAGQEGI